MPPLDEAGRGWTGQATRAASGSLCERRAVMLLLRALDLPLDDLASVSPARLHGNILNCSRLAASARGAFGSCAKQCALLGRRRTKGRASVKGSSASLGHL